MRGKKGKRRKAKVHYCTNADKKTIEEDLNRVSVSLLAFFLRQILSIPFLCVKNKNDEQSNQVPSDPKDALKERFFLSLARCYIIYIKSHKKCFPT